MENTFKFRDKLIKISIIVVTVLCVASMSLMIAYAENKVVIVTEDLVEEAESTGIVVASKWMINTDTYDSSKEGIDVSVSFDITEKDIEVATRITEKKVIVTINSAKDNFYLYNPPSGNFEHVASAYGEFDGGKVRITFELDHPMVCEYSYSNRVETLQFSEIVPYEGTVVMLDPGHGGMANGIKVGEQTEQDIVLKIARRAKEMATDKNYVIALTRDDSATLSIEDRLEIIELMGTDYYVGLHLDSDVDNIKNFGMHAAYNEGYYRNGLENSEFADAILKKTVISTFNRGEGVTPATEEEVILRALDVPATILYAGYMSNPDELLLLSSDEYIEKIASGIIEALDETIK